MKKYLTSLLVAGALSVTVMPPLSYADVLDDTTAPTITNIQFDKAAVNAGETIRVYLTVTDDLSGVLGVSFALQSPSGQQQLTPYDIQQDEQGRYYADVTLSPYAESGAWRLVQSIVVDNSYNERETLYDANTIYWFHVLNTQPDTTFPTLGTVELNKTTVSRTDSDPIYLYINASDDLSGVQSVTFVVSDPAGNQIQWSGSLEQDAQGRYFGYVGFPPDGELGTYTVSSIAVRDQATNQLEYLHGTDYSASFTLVE